MNHGNWIPKYILLCRWQVYVYSSDVVVFVPVCSYSESAQSAWSRDWVHVDGGSVRSVALLINKLLARSVAEAREWSRMNLHPETTRAAPWL